MKCGVPTSVGVFEAEWRDGKLIALRFPGATKPAAVPGVREGRRLQLELDDYFAGRQPEFSTALDLDQATPFQRKVWLVLRRIPYGRTMTYGEVARAIGSPGAARAVGAACGQNPVPILIPCHRVVAHGQKLGGFSSGLSWKRRLLALEGAGIREGKEMRLL